MRDPSGRSTPVLSFFGHNDRDLLWHFLAHYQALGAGPFVFVLHGDWPDAAVDELHATHDVNVLGVVGETFSEMLRSETLSSMAVAYRGRWIIAADADEFLQTPTASLGRTIGWLERMGAACLPGLMVQRHTADGSLPEVSPSSDLDVMFPMYSVGLTEDMGVHPPTWKTKFNLSRVDDDFRIRRGSHLPPNPGADLDVPMRAAVHHFKWRSTLLASAAADRGEGANQHEQDVYVRWLAAHDGHLPVENARRCSTPELERRAILVRPDSGRRHDAVLRAAIRSSSATTRARAASKMRSDLVKRAPSLAHLPAPVKPLVDPGALLGPRGRILFVTQEIERPDRNGGVGTAIGCLAEALAAEGHTVHVIYCPHNDDTEIAPRWVDYWRARRVDLSLVPRNPGPGEHRSYPEITSHIAERAAGLAPDVIHITDLEALGAGILLERALRRRFAHTRVLLTTHGSLEWDRRGNGRPEDAFSRANMKGVPHQLRHADVVCHPSRYMQSWIEQNFEPVRHREIVLANCLRGLTRGFGAGRDHIPISEIVFFGRMEPRKGLATFAAAVDELRRDGDGLPPFSVTLLGRIPPDRSREEIVGLFAPNPVGGAPVKVLTDYGSLEAQNYLRTHDCVAVVPSTSDNLPYAVYECLEGRIPLLTSSVGGIPELVHPDDRARTLRADSGPELAAALRAALRSGTEPSRSAVDPDMTKLAQLAMHAGLVRETHDSRSSGGSGWPRLPSTTERLQAMLFLHRARPVSAHRRSLRARQRRAIAILRSPSRLVAGVRRRIGV